MAGPMSGVAMVARSELRRRRRSLVVLTVLVAVSAAVTLALVAGARRTSSALVRFETFSQSADVELTVGEATDEQLRAFAHVPGVKAFAPVRQVTLVVKDSRRFLPTAAQSSDAFGTTVDRPVVVKGRLANQASADEVVIGEALAEQLDIGVGDRIRFDSYSTEQVRRGREEGDPLLTPEGPDVSLRVVGIVRRPLDLGGRGAEGGVVVPTEAFDERYRDTIGSFAGTILRVRTERGQADVDRVARAARRIFGGSPEFQVQTLGIEGQGAQNAIDVTTVALEIAAVIAAIVALVGIAIALSREVSLADNDQTRLRALGLSRRHRAAAAAAVAVPPAVVGALLGAAASVFASPLFPIGVARKAEVDRGIRVDSLVVLGGLAVVMLAVLAIGALAAWRTAGASDRVPPERRASISRATGGLALRPPAAIGIGFALDRGRGRRAAPVWSSVIGTAFGIVVVVAVALFSASLDQLVSDPAAYGWTWDYVTSDTTAAQTTAATCGDLDTRLTTMKGVAAVASICTLDLDVAGHPVSGWGYTDLRGHIGPTIVSGRAPKVRDEVALGADTLAAVHRQVGDTVRITGARGPYRFRIVGQTLLSRLGDPEPLADGAVFTGAGAARLDSASSDNSSWNLIVRLAPGVDRSDTLARLDAISRPDTPLLGAALPAEIDRIRQIDALPIALAAFVGAVALAAVGFALVTTVRRRRRELAVLKTLGFRRGQVRATVAWHATTVAVVGLVVGIPLGLVVGRFLWQEVATELGVSTDPTWPVLAAAVLVPVALVAVNLIAAYPARSAARTRPAVVLRSE